MCRLALFSNPNRTNNLPLNYIVINAPNSLAKQSYLPPFLPGLRWFKNLHLRNPTLNQDGYGMFYLIGNELFSHKSKNAIANPESHKVVSNLKNQIDDKDINWGMFFIRNNNFKNKYLNHFRDVQPFKCGPFLFAHNGGFNTNIKKYLPKIKPWIKPKYLRQFAEEELDSKWLFALFLSLVDSTKSNEEIVIQIEEFLSIMHKIKDIGFDISLNILFTNLNNDINIGLRYRTCKQVPPSLYYNKIHPYGFFISSEPLDDLSGWKLMRNHLIIIRNKEFKSYKLYPEIIKCALDN